MGLSLSRCCIRRSSRIGTGVLAERISSSHSRLHALSALIPEMSEQLNSSSLRRNFGNHLTVTSTPQKMEFVHGIKNQNIDMKLDEDGFHFHHLIDTGGFGFVFKASRKTTRVDYALKVQPLEFMARMGNGPQKSNAVSLQMEKTALAACRGHPFIVSLEYSFQTSLYAILVLEHVPGGTLSRLISQGSPQAKLPCSLARIYTAEIALALNFMHEKGIIYRDVKPSNILIAADGHIKMTDFGLAGSMLVKKSQGVNPQENSNVEEESTNESEVQDSSDESVSSRDSEWTEDETSNEIQGDLRRVRRRTLCGTAGYRPPEQVGERYVDYHNRNGYDERVDFFSLGVTLYTMLCGRRPFPTRRQMILNQEGVSSPTQRRSSISDNHTSALQRKVTRQLRKDIEFRCLMSEVTFPDDLLDTEAESFVRCLLARDPNVRPRFDGIKNHPWMSSVEFDAASLCRQETPDWVQTHALRESKSRPKSMRRSSMTNLNNFAESSVSLSSFIENICAQMIEIGKSEEAEKAVERWTTKPTLATKELFRDWNYVSDDALKLEMNATKTHAMRKSYRHRRRATTEN